jgi:hypothetical protein
MPHPNSGHMQNPAMGMPMGGVVSGQPTNKDNNMVMGNMSSSMNQLMDENRYLQMLQ